MVDTWNNHGDERIIVKYYWFPKRLQGRWNWGRNIIIQKYHLVIPPTCRNLWTLQTCVWKDYKNYHHD